MCSKVVSMDKSFSWILTLIWEERARESETTHRRDIIKNKSQSALRGFDSQTASAGEVPVKSGVRLLP